MRASRLLVALYLLTTGCFSSFAEDLVRRPYLTGTVTIDGVPVPGITVTLVATRSSHTTTTGPYGNFEFYQVPFGDATVSLSGHPPMVVFDPPSHEVDLGAERYDVKIDFKGYSPTVFPGRVVWEYRDSNVVGFPGVSARIDQPPYPVASVTSAADGNYRLLNAPGYGTSDVVLSPPSGVSVVGGNRRQFSSASARLRTDTAYVTYDPAADLRVQVFVDGQLYQNVLVDLSTPLPVSGPPDMYTGLPVMPLQVRISGFSSAISFDATGKTVDLTRGSNTVTFTGYTPNGNRPPVPTILAPVNNARFFRGVPITLQGSGTDYEDGVLTGAALDWYTPGRGSYGYGHTITIDTLPVGQHRIVLRATDRQGSTAVAFVDITVLATTGGHVSGNVTIDNGPGFHVWVDLSTTPVQSRLTDLAGNYTFTNVPAGNYTVSVRPVTCVEFGATSRAVAVTMDVTTTANFIGLSRPGCYDYGYGGGGYVTTPKPPPRPPR